MDQQAPQIPQFCNREYLDKFAELTSRFFDVTLAKQWTVVQASTHGLLDNREQPQEAYAALSSEYGPLWSCCNDLYNDPVIGKYVKPIAEKYADALQLQLLPPEARVPENQLSDDLSPISEQGQGRPLTSQEASPSSDEWPESPLATAAASAGPTSLFYTPFSHGCTPSSQQQQTDSYGTQDSAQPRSATDGRPSPLHPLPSPFTPGLSPSPKPVRTRAPPPPPPLPGAAGSSGSPFLSGNRISNHPLNPEPLLSNQSSTPGPVTPCNTPFFTPSPCSSSPAVTPFANSTTPFSGGPPLASSNHPAPPPPAPPLPGSAAGMTPKLGCAVQQRPVPTPSPLPPGSVSGPAALAAAVANAVRSRSSSSSSTSSSLAAGPAAPPPAPPLPSRLGAPGCVRPPPPPPLPAGGFAGQPTPKPPPPPPPLPGKAIAAAGQGGPRPPPPPPPLPPKLGASAGPAAGAQQPQQAVSPASAVALAGAEAAALGAARLAAAAQAAAAAGMDAPLPSPGGPSGAPTAGSLAAAAAAVAGARPAPNGTSPRTAAQADKQYRTLHVDPVPSRLVQSESFWIEGKGLPQGRTQEEMRYLLGRMFSSSKERKTNSSPRMAGSTGGSPRPPEGQKAGHRPDEPAVVNGMLRVIAQKRAFNVEVVLKRIGLEASVLAQYLDTLDDRALNVDQVVSVSKILPTPDEVEKVRKAKEQALAKAKAEEDAATAAAAAAEAQDGEDNGPPSSRSDSKSDSSQTKSHRSHGLHSSRSQGAASSRSRNGGAAAAPGGVRLGPVEYLFEALGGVAFLDAKIRAMQFRNEVDSVTAFVLDYCQVLDGALTLLHSSGTITTLLLLVRDAVNIMNEHRHAGPLIGFKLASLAKLKGTKMFDATDIHVIHFLVGYLEWVAPHITKMDDERKVLQAAVKKGPLDAVQQRLATLQSQQRMLQRDVEEARKSVQHQQSDQGAERQQQQDMLATPRSTSSRCSSRAHQHLQMLTPGSSTRLKRVTSDAMMATAGSCTLSRNNSISLPPLGPARCPSSCSTRSMAATPGLRESGSTEGGEGEEEGAEAPEASGGHIRRGQELYAGRLQALLDRCGPSIAAAAKELADVRQKFLWCAEYFSEDVVTGKNGEGQPVPLLRHILDFLEDINNAKRETQKVTKVLSYMEELHRPAPSPPSSVDEEAAADVADDISQHRASFSDEEEDVEGGSELDEDEEEDDDLWDLNLEDDIPLTARGHEMPMTARTRALFTPRVGRAGTKAEGVVPQLQLQAVMRGLAAGAMSARSQLQQHQQLQLSLPGGWLSAARAAAGEEGQPGGFVALPSLSRTRGGNGDESSRAPRDGGDGDGVGPARRGTSRLNKPNLESISDSESESYGLDSSCDFDEEDLDLCSNGSDGSSDGSDGSDDGSDGSDDNSDGSDDGSDGSDNGSDGSDDGSNGSDEGSDGSDDGSDGSDVSGSRGSLGDTVAAAVAELMEGGELKGDCSSSSGSDGDGEMCTGEEMVDKGEEEGSTCCSGEGMVAEQPYPLLRGLPGCVDLGGLAPPGAERSWGSEDSCQKLEEQGGVLGEAGREEGGSDGEGPGGYGNALECTSRCSSLGDRELDTDEEAEDKGPVHGAMQGEDAVDGSNQAAGVGNISSSMAFSCCSPEVGFYTPIPTHEISMGPVGQQIEQEAAEGPVDHRAGGDRAGNVDVFYTPAPVAAAGAVAAPDAEAEGAAACALLLELERQDNFKAGAICAGREGGVMDAGQVGGSGSSEGSAGVISSCRKQLQPFGLQLQEGLISQLELSSNSPACRRSEQGSPASSSGLQRKGQWSPAARGSPAGSPGDVRGSPGGSGTPGTSSGEGGLPWEVPSVRCRLWPGGSFPQPDFDAENEGK